MLIILAVVRRAGVAYPISSEDFAVGGEEGETRRKMNRQRCVGWNGKRGLEAGGLIQCL